MLWIFEVFIEGEVGVSVLLKSALEPHRQRFPRLTFNSMVKL